MSHLRALICCSNPPPSGLGGKGPSFAFGTAGPRDGGGSGAAARPSVRLQDYSPAPRWGGREGVRVHAQPRRVQPPSVSLFITLPRLPPPGGDLIVQDTPIIFNTGTSHLPARLFGVGATGGLSSPCVLLLLYRLQAQHSERWATGAADLGVPPRVPCTSRAPFRPGTESLTDPCARWDREAPGDAGRAGRVGACGWPAAELQCDHQ